MDVNGIRELLTAPTVHTAECGHGDEDRDKESESTV